MRGADLVNLPLPPEVEAISRLEDLEAIAERFRQERGFYPELVSHWDPKPEFGRLIEGWVRPRSIPTSLVDYVYSSDVNIDLSIYRTLRERPERALVLTPSGTASMVNVLAYLKNAGVKRLAVVAPSYFVVEVVSELLAIDVIFVDVVRVAGGYKLPSTHDIQSAGVDAVWFTFPVYGTSVYFSPNEIGALIDSIATENIVVVDDSLAFPDTRALSETAASDRVIRISTPHKSICVNGEKVSIISAPENLRDRLHAWSDCFSGGIGAGGRRALDFLASERFDATMTKFRDLVRDRAGRFRKVVAQGSGTSLDKETDGHFVMANWPKLPATLGANTSFMRQIVEASGAAPIPATRNRHPAACGFSFRVNLLRLDDAGLGGLSRLVGAVEELAARHQP